MLMDVIVLANIITSISKNPCLMRPFSEFPSVVTIDKFVLINEQLDMEFISMEVIV